MTVSALLVSHDGARWLTAVLDGLARQTRRPEHVLAVDTGSRDTSPGLLRERLGADAVTDVSARSSYGAAVAAGLRALPPAEAPETDWVWLLHDDSSPAPDALEKLLLAADRFPSVSILGAKLREWPSLRRLLEVGVTISGTGHRETGLEPGEYDQGQHDQTVNVLAVNTAGMLVRREVLADLGFDERLPVLGTDLDFGWRAARAGHRTVAVPDAVVFHVEAAHRGVRDVPGTTSVRRTERRAALYTILVNCSLPALAFQAVRLCLGSLLRSLGLLLVRAPRACVDELGALLATYLRPDRIVAGRAERRSTARVRSGEVRHLLAPPWTPYRHGLDFLADLGSAVARRSVDVSAGRRRGPVETGPVPEEAQNLPADTGLTTRLVTSPVAVVFALLTLVAAAGARGLLGPGMLSGGALLPAPETAADWWATYLEPWHRVGVGSAMPAAPYLLPLAVLGTVLLGKAWLVVDLLFFFVVPLAAFGGYRFLRLLTGSRSTSLWGAAAYGLLPVLDGAVRQGRLGTVAAAVVLPWLAHAAWFLGAGHPADRRWRAAWRTSLWLAVLTAFAPAAALIAAAVAVTALVVIGGTRSGSARARVSMVLPVLTTLLAVPVLLLPWSVLVWAHQGGDVWAFEAGAPAPSLVGPVDAWAIVLGRPAGAGSAPAWISAGVALAALAGLIRADTRRRVLAAWVVVVVALAAVCLLTGRTFTPASGGSEQPAWLGLPLLVVSAAAICAAALAGTGVWSALSGSSFGWRQPVGLAVAAAAVLSPVAGLVWWATAGDDGPLGRRPATTAPTYMTDAATADPDRGVLVVRGSRRAGFEYVVLRGDGRRLGEDSVSPAARAQGPVTDLVADLATAPDARDIGALATHGVQFVYAPAPVDSRLVSNLDSASGVTAASALRPGSRAWQLETTATDKALPQPETSPRRWLLLLQVLAVAGTVVLAAPSRRVRR